MSTRKGSGESNVIESALQAVFEHCLISFPKTISICCRGVWFYLVFEKITEFFLELGPFALLRRRPLLIGWWRRVRRWRWRRRIITSWRTTRNLRIQPHMSQHLAYTFFHIRTQSRITWSNANSQTLKLDRHINEEEIWKNRLITFKSKPSMHHLVSQDGSG